MSRKYQIFVSSTYEDLQEERRRVMEQILNFGHIPVGMELFQASDETQWKYITQRIHECDYFMIIVAERYGSMDASGVSFTQKEFQYAVEKKVPVVAFLLSPRARAGRLAVHVEHGRKTEIDALRSLCSTDRLVKYWSDASDLAANVTASLSLLMQQHPRPGLVSAEAWLVDRLGLGVVNSESKSAASSQLIAAIRSDLAASGYYRKKQIISISLTKNSKDVIISLVFDSILVPVREEAQVYRPKVEAPPNAELMIDPPPYSVNGVAFDGPYHPVSAESRERLSVQYRIKDRSRIEISDIHSWRSSVLDYAVRFEPKSGYSFKVWKLNGQEHGERIEWQEDAAAGYVEFVGRGAAFTAQGLKWQITAL